jgi:hypothetical protein
MHPEMYLPMQRLIERERDERLALRRPGQSERPRPSGECAGRAQPAGTLSRALASFRAAAAPSSCCAIA